MLMQLRAFVAQALALCAQCFSGRKMPVVPVRYYCCLVDGNGLPDLFDEGCYVWVFKVVGPGAGSWNNNLSDDKGWGQGPNPVRMRYFASTGVYFNRRDCARDARSFGLEHGVRVVLLCVPLPVKFGMADYHLNVVRPREHRRAVIIRWMLGAQYCLEVAERIAEFLVGRKLTNLGYSAWLRFN